MSVHETRGTASGTEEVGRDVEWNVLAVDGAATNRVHTTGGTIRPSTHHDVLGSTSPRVLSEAQSIKRAWREANALCTPSPVRLESNQALVRDGTAQGRLEELEDRIHKLHLLEERMLDQYTTQHARESVPHSPDGESAGFSLLSAAPHDAQSSMDSHVQLNASTVGVHFEDSPRERDPFPDRPHHTAFGVLDGRYSSPEDYVRNIVREELRTARSANMNVSFASERIVTTSRSRADSDSTEDDIILAANKSKTESDQNEHDSFARSAGSEKTNAKEEVEPGNSSAALAERHRLHRVARKKPATLQDAEPVSCPYLFGGFTRRSQIRQVCFRIHSSVKWEVFFIFMTMANSIYIATAPGYTNPVSIMISWYFEFLCACIFCAEVMSGLIAYGAFRGKSSYLQNDSFHRLDFMCFIFVVFEYSIASWDMWPNLTLRPFRMFRLFKVLTKVHIFRGIKFILLTLTDGGPQFGVLFGVLFLTAIGWIILTMTLYGKSMRRRCVTLDTLVPACASDFSTNFNATCNFNTEASRKTAFQPGGQVVITGGYPFEKFCSIVATEHELDSSGKWVEPRPAGRLVTKGYLDYGNVVLLRSWPKDPKGRYHSCQAKEWREAMKRGEDFSLTQTCEDLGPTANPQMGYAHFDNIWGTAASLTQVIMQNGYNDVWYRAIESEPMIEGFTYFLFPFISVINTFLLLGMFVAVVTGTFFRIRDEQQQDQFTGITLDGNVLEANTPSPIAKVRDYYNDDESPKEGIKDELQQIQDASRWIVRESWFIHGMNLIVVWHIYSLAAEDFDSSAFWIFIYDWSNFGCSMAFLVENCLHFSACGSWRKFLARHQAETILVLISLVALAAGNTFLKAICALRGFRLTKYFNTIEHLYTCAQNSFLAMINVTFFSFVVMFCFTVTGRYLYGNNLNEFTRSNFSSLSLASLSMFQLFTGDSWSKIMYSAMMSMPEDDLMAQGAGAFFVVVWFLFATIIINNLFVSVILTNFDVLETIHHINSPGNVQYWWNQLNAAYAYMYAQANVAMGGALSAEAEIDARRESVMQKVGEKGKLFSRDEVAVLERGLVTNPENLYMPTVKRVPPIMLAVQSVALLEPYIPEEEKNRPKMERILFMFEPDSLVCRVFKWLGRQVWFDGIVLACILVSCFFLIIEPPYRSLDKNPLVPYFIMDILNPIFTFVFSVEFVVRVLSQGLLLTEDAYLKSGWNIIDTVVLLFAWLELGVNMEKGGIAKVLRMGKVMRPLRFLKRNESMRHIIDTLIGTSRPLIYVIVFFLFNLIVFSCMAMAIFRGGLYKCNNPSLEWPLGKRECSGVWYRNNGIMLAAAWENPYWFNFDSFSSAMISLFQVSCFKYVSILYACMDMSGKDASPKQGASAETSIFFVGYILLGGVFVMNLFTGFVVEGFKANKGISELETIFRRYTRQLRDSAPVYDTFKPPSNPVSSHIRIFLQSRPFQTFSTLCVMTNVGFMLADNSDAAGTPYGELQDLQNFIFFLELVAEIVLGLLGYGPGGLYNDKWRFFDVIVCVGTSLGYISQTEALVSFARLFRLARVVRLMIKFRQIKIILDTMVRTIPQLANILILLAIVFTMCAVLGVQMFATTKRGYRLGPTANFDTFAPAMAAVWMMVTGDEWMIVLQDCAVSPPYCTETFVGEDWNDCGSKELSYIYFITVKVICEFIMFNLFIGVIVDNFSYITEDVGHEEDEKWTEGPSLGQLDDLCELFQKYDHGTGYVPITSLHCILCDMPPPLGYRRTKRSFQYSEMDLLLEKMIRAELNVILVEHREKDKLKRASLTFRLGLVAPAPLKKFLHGISYEDFFFTVTCWRLPRLLPDKVKWQRSDRVQEVAHMAASLTVSDFFRFVGARRKQKVLQHELQKRVIFEQWARADDPHRSRWEDLHRTQKIAERRMAQDYNVPVGMLLPEPSSTRVLVAEYLNCEGMPPEFLDHSHVVKEKIGRDMKVPQPVNSIEMLKKMCEEHVLVLKALDPFHRDILMIELADGEKQDQAVVIDFGELRWRGWRAENTRHETLFGPTTFSGFSEDGRRFAPEPWDRVDVFLKSRVESSTGKSQKSRLGSCLDFQSYITDDRTVVSAKMAERASCNLRLNLGDFLYTSKKIQHQLNFWHEQQQAAKGVLGKLKQRDVMPLKPEKPTSEDKRTESEVEASGCVMQVVGYLPRDIFKEKYRIEKQFEGRGETENDESASSSSPDADGPDDKRNQRRK